MDFATALYVLGAAVAGALVALRYIAPRTANKTDDRVLETLEVIAPIVQPKTAGDLAKAGDEKVKAPGTVTAPERTKAKL